MKAGVRRNLKRARHWLENLSGPCGIILLYHRIAESRLDPYSLCVTPAHFAEHLEVIRKLGQPVRLQQMTADLRAGKRAHKRIAISFDDGYADNLHNAKPVLEKYDVPAMVFLTAGYVGSNLAFWWDELARLLLQPGTLPEKLRLNLQGRSYEWDLGESACYTEEQYRRHQGWNYEVLEKDDPTARHQCFRSLWALLKPLSFEEQQRVIKEVSEWTGTKPKGRPSPGPLTSEEVFQLIEGGLIEAGAHTRTHPILSLLPASAQQKEIVESKRVLEDLLNRPLDHFAYPYGDYGAETMRLVREAGFASACSVQDDSVWQSSDLFQMPRIVVGDCDGEELARRIKPLLN